MYIQCKLKYEDGKEGVFWIEKNYAKERKLIFDEEFEKRCTVTEVYRDNVMSKEQMRKSERMFKSFKRHDGEYK